jgi:uncharacterized protein (TIGR01777 family)
MKAMSIKVESSGEGASFETGGFSQRPAEMKSDRGTLRYAGRMVRFSSMPPPEKIGISRACLFGGSGLIGRALATTLERDGVEVTLYRRPHGKGGDSHGKSAKAEARHSIVPIHKSTAAWDPAARTLDLGPVERAEAVVNLAGESLADGMWTRSKKQRIWSSRVDVTQWLCTALAGLPEGKRPQVLINASAVGFYGDRGLEHVSEDSQRGRGFLAELCEAWEAATRPAREAGIRVVNVRFGVVLAPEGGALAKMLPIFSKGLGGRFGDGQQAMPWITLTDAVGVMRFAIMRPDLHGPLNAVAPEQITNAQLTDALSRSLGKPARLPVPAFALRTLLGEMARETLLNGARVHPRKLEIAGYRFEYPRLDDALFALMTAASSAGHVSAP